MEKFAIKIVESWLTKIIAFYTVHCTPPPTINRLVESEMFKERELNTGNCLRCKSIRSSCDHQPKIWERWLFGNVRNELSSLTKTIFKLFSTQATERDNRSSQLTLIRELLAAQAFTAIKNRCKWPSKWRCERWWPSAVFACRTSFAR